MKTTVIQGSRTENKHNKTPTIDFAYKLSLDKHRYTYHDDISYNLPKFCSNATWNAYGITLVNKSILASEPVGLFVDISNTVHVADENNDRVLVWLEGSSNPTRTISGILSKPRSVFSTTNGDIYIDNGENKGEVDKWKLNQTNGVMVMSVNKQCDGLFVDLNNTLFCSMKDANQVVKKSLNTNGTASSTAAGTGSGGSGANELNEPRGIFVDINFNLYIADTNNDRIQRFAIGQTNGVTVAGKGAGNISLHSPTDVVLDSDGYLFIVDSDNYRIVGSGLYGFRCLVGCTGSSGSQSNQLQNPRMLSFDSYGNIFVSDRDNDRIQKFLLATNSCVSMQSTQSVYTTAIPTTSIMKETTSLDPVLSSTVITTDHTSTVPFQSTRTYSISSTLVTTRLELSTAFTTDFISLPITTTARETIITSTHLTQTQRRSTIKTSMLPETTTALIKSLLSSNFYPPTCNDSLHIGFTCNIFAASCNISTPCQNAGTCINNNSASNGYTCQCPSGFNGTYCEHDFRPCKLNTCWNNGSCLNGSNGGFKCICADGWTGIHCEKMINYCHNISCHNNGVCQPLFRDYQCECLNSYSGRHCETTSNSLVTRQIISRSLGYVAIIFIISVFIFVGILDIMKYILHIDLGRNYHRRSNRKRRKKEPTIAIHFTYVP